MITRTMYRQLFYLQQIIKTHFKNHLTLYLIGLIGFLLFFTTGIFTAIKYVEVVEITDISDATLISYLSKDISIFGLFFSRLLGYLFLSLLFILTGFISWLIPIGYALFFYKSYLAGITISFFIILFGITGFLLTILVLLPVTLFCMFAYLALLSTCAKRCYICKKFGCNFFCNESPSYLFFILKAVCCLFLVACIIQLIFLPILSAGIFIII